MTKATSLLRSLVAPLETATLHCMRIDLARRCEKTSAEDHPELRRELQDQLRAIIAEIDSRNSAVKL